MPQDVKIKLMKDFMHRDFLAKFKNTFYFPNRDVKIKHAYYGWNDEPYISFMFEVLNHLEPRREEAMELICNQNEEVNEVLFFDFGTYVVGFDINNKSKFVMRFKKSNVINAYACTLNLRSEWIYKTTKVCTGYSIRRQNWKALLNTHHKIVDELIEQITYNYQ